MTYELLIYGANGYTGAHVARQAVEMGLKPRLAGRNMDAVRAVADELALEWVAVSVDDPSGLDAALQDTLVVLHCAGPFRETSAPMIDACLRTKTHYIDITGEIDVLVTISERDQEAKKAGIMLLPACGFDTVPGDCLSLHLKQRLPEADTLRLSISVPGLVSRGTLRTALQYISQGVLVRRNGEIVELKENPSRLADFGEGPVPALAVSWADVMTAYHSTGIPNIEVYFEATPQIKQVSAMPRLVKKLLGTAFGQALLARQVRDHPLGPDLQEEYAKNCVLIGEASSLKTGESRKSQLHTRGPYWLTVRTVLLAAQNVISGNAPTGFQTPASAFGSDFILAVDGSKFLDL